MEDIPQPASEPFDEGDVIKVYLDEGDRDSKYHGVTGRITEVTIDELGEETGRELDSYSYKIEVRGEELDLWFRHYDLLPVDG